MSSNLRKEKDALLREYASLATEYDNRWSHYTVPSIRETIRRMDIKSTEQLLDVGCGTGTLLESVAESFPDAGLFGVDPSSEMLAVAGEKLGSDVELKEGVAESLPFADGSFDMVVSCSSFHYWREPEKALVEITRVLKPGGRVVITDWCVDYLSCRLCDIYLRLVNHAHHRTYGTKRCARFLGAAGFSDVRIDQYKINWLWGMMTATARLR
jgi:ubiquinone/menaquinone biosynthesis C-methylase UbiE